MEATRSTGCLADWRRGLRVCLGAPREGYMYTREEHRRAHTAGMCDRPTWRAPGGCITGASVWSNLALFLRVPCVVLIPDPRERDVTGTASRGRYRSGHSPLTSHSCMSIVHVERSIARGMVHGPWSRVERAASATERVLRVHTARTTLATALRLRPRHRQTPGHAPAPGSTAQLTHPHATTTL